MVVRHKRTRDFYGHGFDIYYNMFEAAASRPVGWTPEYGEAYRRLEEYAFIRKDAHERLELLYKIRASWLTRIASSKVDGRTAAAAYAEKKLEQLAPEIEYLEIIMEDCDPASVYPYATVRKTDGTVEALGMSDPYTFYFLSDHEIVMWDSEGQTWVTQKTP